MSDYAAYGGSNWIPRTTSLREEMGDRWARCGIHSEWEPLRAVLLHRPGAEVADLADPDTSLMLARPDSDRMQVQHDAMAEVYRREGVIVHYVDPPQPPPPNQMFCADLMLATPEGVIVGRPASPVRAGEERWLARRLAEIGTPIVRTVAGRGTFEGADAAWLAPDTVLIGWGLRTNPEGAAQIAATLAEQGVRTLRADLPHGAMHLMGLLRIVDRDLALIRAGRTPWTAVEALHDHGFRVFPFPSDQEAMPGMAHNFVTLGPRRILMPEGNPLSQQAYEEMGITCVTAPVDEFSKAAGSIGCLSGVLERES